MTTGRTHVIVKEHTKNDLLQTRLTLPFQNDF